LRRFPFDKLKIDKTFIDNIGDDSESFAIVDYVAKLAQTLGIRTTAEGVETRQQQDAVQAMGCDEIQGFLISRPRPFSEIAALLPRNSSSPAIAA
jgi:EAL domain-containing protein (putative c-di-GMP-specific phosphodiesterase class I)